MAGGIYIHVPFCKKACNYCDFHFSTSLKYVEEMTEAICIEIWLKKDRISQIDSIYFGGGTPSLLPLAAFEKIFDTISQCFTVSENAEITIETNPDDLNAKKISELRKLPVNRLSIGIQSFFEEDLLWMNRAHTSEEALSCVKRSQDAGFENLTIDLIYGFPLLTDEKWLKNIQTATDLKTPHISAYSLTVEEGTALSNAINKGKQSGMNDEQSAAQFLILSEKLTKAGFEHYEISNYGVPGKFAIHNTNYWKGMPYLGIGPSAHGFDGENRYVNVANNEKYLSALGSKKLAETIEELSEIDKFNEYMMTSLRTMWGTDLNKIERNFGVGSTAEIRKKIGPYIDNGMAFIDKNTIFLTDQGKLFADGITTELFKENY
jgi:oxygen-independent coproporphyrinogen-3 oxidase